MTYLDKIVNRFDTIINLFKIEYSKDNQNYAFRNNSIIGTLCMQLPVIGLVRLRHECRKQRLSLS